MMMPTSAAGNKVPAIGTPDAKLFFEPQKSKTIESRLVSPSQPASTQQMTNTKANRPQLRIVITIKLMNDSRVQRPSTTDALIAV